ncbi:methyltransferase [Cellulosilyticum sp. I15G10I2]|uniref:methyltransferase n=1 Tax=Cellulosilyticum sp. I15G10I2 TaxID=1892843 RepID=UPI00085C9CF7|nr:methyltransferase [Cellulosilyticum sp. I15G10I2]
MKPNEEQLWYKEARSLKYFLHRQLWQLLTLLILVPITWAFAAPVMGGNSWLGITDITWFWLAIGVSIIHQVVVWIVFRLQLGWGTLSKIFGDFDLFVWALLFLPFLLARVISLVGLAYVNSGTLVLPDKLAITLAFFLIIPAIYTLWSVIRYFGLIRALGADHFRISYRKMPLVKKGIFKWNNNSMYSFAFLMLWAIALLLGSQAALSVALFQHVYIWVHYFCTEKPDMEIIYSIKN